MGRMTLRVGLVIIALLVASCGGTPPIRQSAYPIDCRKNQPIKDLLQRGDVHRNRLMEETPPEGIEPAQWKQARKIHASRARTCYQVVIDTKPDHAYALLNMGFTHLVESAFPDQTPEGRDKALIIATNYVQQSLDARQLDAQATYYLGEIAARRGQCDKALRIFNALISSRWSYSHVYAWMGYCEEAGGRPAEAQQAYQKAVDLSSPVGIAEWARSKIKQ